MKRFIVAICCAVLILSMLPGRAQAAPEYKGTAITKGNVVLIDAKTGNILYKKNSTDKSYPASTTKIMTALITLESGKSLDDKVTVGSEVNTTGSTVTPALKPSEQVTLKDLMYCMMLVSGNDAANAVAKYVGDGSIDNFVAKMNEKAKALGMKGTNFTVPHGLHQDDHYSTPEDMAILTRAAMQNEQFRKIVSTEKYTVPATNKDKSPRELINTNKLISTDPKDSSFKYDGATGIKTGSTPKGGNALVASAKKGDMELIAVILGTDYNNNDIRFKIAKDLFDYGFGNYTSIDLNSYITSDALMASVKSSANSKSLGDGLQVALNYGSSSQISLSKENASKITADPTSLKLTTEVNNGLSATIKKNDKIGTATLKVGEEQIAVFDIIAANDMGGPTPSGISSTFPPGKPTVKPGSDTDRSVLLWLLIPIGIIVVVIIVLRRKNNRSRRRRAARYSYHDYRGKF